MTRVKLSPSNLTPDKYAVNANKLNKPQYLSALYKQFVVSINNTYTLFLAERALFLSLGAAFSSKVS